ncbi:MAG TPA: hypothetical protein VGI60_02515 [Chthoniobacterales bacterium]|jgi:hypothetical protein
MLSRFHALLTLAVLLLVTALWPAAVSGDATFVRLAAPQGGITAVYYNPVTGVPNRVSFVNAQGQEIFAQDYSGSSYVLGPGEWTASGRFFVYPLLDCGDHATFLSDRFDLVDIKTLRRYVGDQLPPGNPITPEFKLSKEDTITFYEVDLSNNNRLVPHSLSLSQEIPSLGGESLVGMPSEEELNPYYDAYWTAQKTGVCNIHKVPMKKKLVPIVWGLMNIDIGPLLSTQIRFFPHARDYVNGGCEIDPARKNTKVPIYICPECQRAQLEWINAHPQDPWSKSWIDAHKASN